MDVGAEITALERNVISQAGPIPASLRNDEGDIFELMARVVISGRPTRPFGGLCLFDDDPALRLAVANQFASRVYDLVLRMGRELRDRAGIERDAEWTEAKDYYDVTKGA